MFRAVVDVQIAWLYAREFGQIVHNDFLRGDVVVEEGRAFERTLTPETGHASWEN